ncbi:MAG: hypothetical protein H6736_16815 [Alphaproteobacteria bacterium]|nr:hypothetical protein [Alphaproteobacteria bacterium]MCB9693475.1 hypothetical protein [Alphaproteobacteria bacterium]
MRREGALFREEPDRVLCLILDEEASAVAKSQSRYGCLYVVVVLLSLTIVGIPVAWAVAVVVVLLTPRTVVGRIEVTHAGVSVGQVHSRHSPHQGDLVADRWDGPHLLGLGRPAEPVFLPFSELRQVVASPFGISFIDRQRRIVEVRTSRMDKASMERVAQAIEAIRARHDAGAGTAADAEAQQARLAGLTARE